jgi:hypothetical protein
MAKKPTKPAPSIHAEPSERALGMRRREVPEGGLDADVSEQPPSGSPEQIPSQEGSVISSPGSHSPSRTTVASPHTVAAHSFRNVRRSVLPVKETSAHTGL